MATKLQACLSFTLSEEGEVTTDEGGLTKWGISQKAYPDEDIANLNKERRDYLYERDYYNKVGAAYLSTPLAILVFDSAVNCGLIRTVKWLQIIVNMLTSAALATDGYMGIQTLQAIEKADQKVLAMLAYQQRMLHYCSLRKNQPENFGGWMNRMTDLLRVVGCGFNAGGCHETTGQMV